MEASSGMGGSGIFFLVIIGLMIVMMIFSSRSNKKAMEQRQAMLKGIKAGDEIETVGRMIGKVISVSGDRLTVDFGPDGRNSSQIVIHVEGVHHVINGETPQADDKKEDKKEDK